MAEDTRKSSSTARAILWLAIALVVGIAAYAGGWFYIAARIHAASLDAMEDAAARGVSLACENSRIEGFPFRFGLHCDSILAESRRNAVRIAAGPLRTAAQFYNPSFLVGELDGEAHVELPGIRALTLNWDWLGASVRYARPFPQRLSFEARDFVGALEAGAVRLFRADNAQLHLRGNDGTLDLAASLTAAKLEDGVGGVATLPPVNASADLTLADGIDWLMGLRGSLRGQSGTIRNLTVSAGRRASIHARGTFSVDGNGLADAKLTVSVTDPKEVGELIAAAFPDAADQARQIAGNLAFFGSVPELPVTVKKGVVSIGPFQVGTLGPLP